MTHASARHRFGRIVPALLACACCAALDYTPQQLAYQAGHGPTLSAGLPYPIQAGDVMDRLAAIDAGLAVAAAGMPGGTHSLVTTAVAEAVAGTLGTAGDLAWNGTAPLVEWVEAHRPAPSDGTTRVDLGGVAGLAPHLAAASAVETAIIAKQAVVARIQAVAGISPSPYPPVVSALIVAANNALNAGRAAADARIAANAGSFTGATRLRADTWVNAGYVSWAADIRATLLADMAACAGGDSTAAIADTAAFAALPATFAGDIAKVASIDAFIIGETDEVNTHIGPILAAQAALQTNTTGSVGDYDPALANILAALAASIDADFHAAVDLSTEAVLSHIDTVAAGNIGMLVPTGTMQNIAPIVPDPDGDDLRADIDAWKVGVDDAVRRYLYGDTVTFGNDVCDWLANYVTAKKTTITSTYNQLYYGIVNPQTLNYSIAQVENVADAMEGEIATLRDRLLIMYASQNAAGIIAADSYQYEIHDEYLRIKALVDQLFTSAFSSGSQILDSLAADNGGTHPTTPTPFDASSYDGIGSLSTNTVIINQSLGMISDGVDWLTTDIWIPGHEMLGTDVFFNSGSDSAMSDSTYWATLPFSLPLAAAYQFFDFAMSAFTGVANSILSSFAALFSSRTCWRYTMGDCPGDGGPGDQYGGARTPNP